MSIELAGIKLNKVHRLETLEQQNFVFHQIPGKQGSTSQNLGRDVVRLRLNGICYGENAVKDLAKIRTVYKDQKPVDFLADIIGQSYFSQVLIERFEVIQSVNYPDQFTYQLILAEYTNDTQTSAVSDSGSKVSGTTKNSLAKVNESVKMNAKTLMSNALLPTALQIGSIPEVTNPFEPISVSIDPIQEATSTLDQGVSDLKSLFNL